MPQILIKSRNYEIKRKYDIELFVANYRSQHRSTNLNDSEILSKIYEITNILENFKLEYWVTNGTLLGLTRDGMLIPWDDDFDIDLNSKVLKDNVARLASIFINMGLPVKIKLNGPFMGMNIFYKNLKFSLGGQIYFFNYMYDYNNKYPRNLIYPIKTSKYLGINLKLPFNPENLCGYIYKDWRVEIKSMYESDYIRKEIRNNFLVKYGIRLLILIMHFFTLWQIHRIKLKIFTFLDHEI